ncbi:hypothetical protein [Synoicihabitans lomoniglobus]|uniref:Uncharacterized protein n=1 Tax=Synoicihabitans lomoniglobus TaxID=2909285 RepID=A0AAF0A1Z3_9BACT|nr:hypothetical protein [Opitutaceae bacterium LMO-M01]WED65512.1 hypothetical protein PXH66_01445 [Opitutaceae bacterium LMO-M01]
MQTETTTETKACATCTHFKAAADGNGECHRRAPQIVTFQVDENVKFESRFPAVAATDWCGEYSA